MKKIILVVASLAMATVSNAQEVVDTKEFTDELWVTIDDMTSGPQMTSVDVEMLDNGNINLVLKNFILDSGDGDSLYVGNIEVENVPLTQEEGVSYKSFVYQDDVTIKNGDDDQYSWIGPLLLGTIYIDMKGSTEGDQLYLTIDIDLTESVGLIYVKFGEELVNSVKAITSVISSVYENRIYDICGRQVSSTRRPGIFIVNGKKVLVK